MAETRQIGNDHQAPFWHLVVVLVLGNQVATRGENKLLNAQYISNTPQPHGSFVTHL